jgi:hypothetical protein
MRLRPGNLVEMGALATVIGAAVAIVALGIECLLIRTIRG